MMCKPAIFACSSIHSSAIFDSELSSSGYPPPTSQCTPGNHTCFRSLGPCSCRFLEGIHRWLRKNARLSSIAMACLPISISGLSATYGSFNGVSFHPTELTVSHTPTKCGLHSHLHIAVLKRSEERRVGK